MTDNLTETLLCYLLLIVWAGIVRLGAYLRSKGVTPYWPVDDSETPLYPIHQAPRVRPVTPFTISGANPLTVPMSDRKAH